MDRIPKGMIDAHDVDGPKPVTTSLVELYRCIPDHTDLLNRTEYLAKINQVSRTNPELVKASRGNPSIDVWETIQSYSDRLLFCPHEEVIPRAGNNSRPTTLVAGQDK